jgi:hypothetical protein
LYIANSALLLQQLLLLVEHLSALELQPLLLQVEALAFQLKWLLFAVCGPKIESN